MKPEDEDLTRRAIAGEREALALVWERERSWLTALVWSRCLDRELARDLIQEGALILVDRIAELREPAALRGWLKRSLLNRLNDELRRRLRSPEAASPVDPQFLSAPPVVADDGIWAQALAELPVDLREPMVLRGIDGLGIQEIAEILELPITTVETRLVRARRNLRERVDRMRALEDGGRRTCGDGR
ncbi:MAG: sigma-70 family RNA polymerase sigma factor [Planctomycetes bacterium]|nr:sigma-70 family RNA polymerase sigma factor [Planctomycetota bacterium]